jgi:hypothetical protein
MGVSVWACAYLLGMFELSETAPFELDLHAYSNWSEQDFRARVDAGERFVVYHYAVSVIFYSFRHPTKVHALRNTSRAILHGLPWSMLTLLLGWWSIPSGPFFTIQCLVINSRGGTDVSGYILEHIRQQDVRYQYGFR